MNISKEKFIEWLNKQPEDRAFNYSDQRNCLFASFLKEHIKLEDVVVRSLTWRAENLSWNDLPIWFYNFSRDLLKTVMNHKDFTIKEIKHLIFELKSK